MIEHVECIHPDFDIDTFSDRRVLGQRQIQIGAARPAKEVSPGGSVRVRWIVCIVDRLECGRVEIVVAIFSRIQDRNFVKPGRKIGESQIAVASARGARVRCIRR